MEGIVRQTSYDEIVKMIDVLAPCMHDYLYVCDVSTDRYTISESAVKRFKLPGKEFTDVIESHRIFIHPDDFDMLVTDLERMMSGEQDFHNLEYRWIGIDGEPIWINCRGFVIKDEEGKPYLMMGCINEIGKKQQADNVSGLLGESSLKQYIQSFDGEDVHGYILRLGIDDFKGINEKKGIEYGDEVLRRTAECINKVLLPGQKLFRVVADEYAIVDMLGGTVEEARKLYHCAQQEIIQYIRQNQYEVFYTISGGILDFDALEEWSYSEMMKFSEFALEQAKRDGKNRCEIYNIAQYEDFLKRRKLLLDLRYAINHNYEGFDAYFQPIVSTEERQLASAETLLRFKHPEFGFVSPMEFIPLLEESGLIIPAGRWVLRRAMRMCKEMQKHIPDFKVSVNISYVQVIKSNVLKDILEYLRMYELDPSSLIIELTESGFIEQDDNFTRFCKGLKENGIPLYLDDFGTGYSNFHYLSDIEPSTIKIDRSFTMKALKNTYEHSLLKHIIDMIHGIKLKMCVEGIETEDELNEISKLQPDYIQGFYFGKPCPANEFFEKYTS